jgi:hypothetical protein
MKNLFNLPSLDISYSDFLEKNKLTYNVFHFQLGLSNIYNISSAGVKGLLYLPVSIAKE